MRYFYYCLLLLMAWFAKAEPTQQRVASEIKQVVEDSDLNSGVVIYSKDGELFLHDTFLGQPSINNQTLNQDTLFRAESLTELFTATLTISLVNNNKLELQESITTRDIFCFRVDHNPCPKITVEQLLTHTAGFGHPDWLPSYHSYRRLNVSNGLDQPGLFIKENLRRLRVAGLNFKPGKRRSPSIGYDVLGSFIEHELNKDLLTLFNQYLEQQLQLDGIYFHTPDQRKVIRPLREHSGQLQELPNNRYFSLGDTRTRVSIERPKVDDSYRSGGAGLLLTAIDVWRIMEAIREPKQDLHLGATATKHLRNIHSPLPKNMTSSTDFNIADSLKEPQSEGWGMGSITKFSRLGHFAATNPATGETLVIMSDTAVPDRLESVLKRISKIIFNSSH